MTSLTFEFPCISCGLCCQQLHRSPFLVHHEINSGNGVCIHLKENLCEIYQKRPMECNIKASYANYDHLFSQNEYLSLNLRACLELMHEAGRADLIDLMSTHERQIHQYMTNTESQVPAQDKEGDH